MRLDNNRVHDGFFWLPGHEEEKVHGTLKISDGGKIFLEVTGSFSDGSDKPSRHQNVSRIHGKVEDLGIVTLDGCFYRNAAPLMTLMKKSDVVFKSEIYVATLFAGVFFQHSDDICFTSVSFTIEGLDQWLRRSGISTSFELGKNSATISYTKPKKIEVSLECGYALEIDHEVILPVTGFNLTHADITETACLILKSETPTGITEIKILIQKLLHFFCFATDSVVCLKNVTGDLSKHNTRVKVFYSSLPFTEQTPRISWPEMCFTYDDIEETIKEKLDNWLSQYEVFSPAIHLYFAAQSGIYQYADSHLLALCQCVETFHRRTSDAKLIDQDEYEHLVKTLVEKCPDEHKRWLKGKVKFGNELSLRQRIKALISPFRTLYGNNKEREEFVSRVVMIRNYLTHFEENGKASTYAKDGIQLRMLSELLEATFQLQVFRILGFDDSYIFDKARTLWQLSSKLEHRFNINADT